MLIDNFLKIFLYNWYSNTFVGCNEYVNNNCLLKLFSIKSDISNVKSELLL